MALNITTIPKKAKPVTKTKPKVQQLPSETEQLVDTIVEQNPAILSAKEPKKVQDSARKELLDMVEAAFETSDEIIVKGTKGQVRFSPCSTKRECVDVKAVHEMLGDEAFYAIVRIGLTDLDKYLTAHQMEQVTEKGCGSRSMTVLPLD